MVCYLERPATATRRPHTTMGCRVSVRAFLLINNAWLRNLATQQAKSGLGSNLRIRRATQYSCVPSCQQIGFNHFSLGVEYAWHTNITWATLSTGALQHGQSLDTGLHVCHLAVISLTGSVPNLKWVYKSLSCGTWIISRKGSKYLSCLWK